MRPNLHSWRHPPDKLVLPKNDVHVWKAALDNPNLPVHVFAQVLSHDERRKAVRYCFDRDKRRYIIGRSVLRSIIGKYYLGIEPSQLEFCYGSHGKPFLEEKFGDGKFRFNQADSNGIALYAFTKDREIGIDLEYIRALPDAQQIVAGTFSEYEKNAFNALPEKEKQEAFFNGWTRKEAFIKSIGKGLYYPLDQFDVSLSPNEPARIISVNGNLAEASRWTLVDIKPQRDFSAAVAFKGLTAGITFWKFPQSL